MSLSKFSRFFRKTTGNSFTDFITRLRINKACQLLMNTDQYVTNVCYDVGFQNVANFKRRFSQIKGVTPKRFRRQAGGRFGAGSAGATGAAADLERDICGQSATLGLA
ncbi:AraC family transcriptional regulator [Massilia sp. P8910]|nr:AraC family transcriptional regulator [Massilia antarctica]